MKKRTYKLISLILILTVNNNSLQGFAYLNKNTLRSLSTAQSDSVRDSIEKSTSPGASKIKEIASPVECNHCGYFSREKLERYAAGAFNMFKDTPIYDEIREAFIEGVPRTVTVDGRRKIEINVPQMHFLNWYERRFRQIRPCASPTFIRGYVHELFHMILYKGGFVELLRAQLEATSQEEVVEFLNHFNQIFGVIRDENNEPVQIDDERLLFTESAREEVDALLEEVGAKYMSSMWEDMSRHQVYYAQSEGVVLQEGQGMLLEPTEMGRVVEGLINSVLEKMAPDYYSQLSLLDIAGSRFSGRRFILALEQIADVSSHVGTSDDILICEDEENRLKYARLKEKVRPYVLAGDVGYSQKALAEEVSITWSLGAGSITGDWTFTDLGIETEFRFSAVCDAVEDAVYTDANNILTDGLRGTFKKEVPLSSVRAINISQFQEGQHAGIFEVEIEIDDANAIKNRGSFIVYVSRAAEENERAVAEHRNLREFRGKNPNYVCDVYTAHTAISSEFGHAFNIELFSMGMLEDFWEISSILRNTRIGHGLVAEGNEGMGVYLNKGGKHRSGDREEGAPGRNIGGIDVERAVKEEIAKIATIYSDPETGRMLNFMVNRGDFVCNVQDGRRPKVKLTCGGDVLEVPNIPSTGAGERSAGALYLDRLLMHREVDIVARQEWSGNSREEYMDQAGFFFEPEDVFNGVLMALIEKHGLREGTERMKIWLFCYCLPILQDVLRESHRELYKPELAESAARYLTNLEDYEESIIGGLRAKMQLTQIIDQAA